MSELPCLRLNGTVCCQRNSSGSRFSQQIGDSTKRFRTLMGDPHPPHLKSTTGRAEDGYPSHTQSLGVFRYKCQSPLQDHVLSRPQCPHLCDGTQMLRTGLLNPQGPPNQRHRPPLEEATKVLVGTAGCSSCSKLL